MVQPIAEAVCNACKSLPPEDYNSIDEQIIPFQGSVPGRQYVIKLPNPLVSKVLCGVENQVLPKNSSILGWEDQLSCT